MHTCAHTQSIYIIYIHTCMHTHICIYDLLFLYLLAMHTWVACICWLLWTVPQWTWECRCSCGVLISFPSDLFPEVGLIMSINVKYYEIWWKGQAFQAHEETKFHICICVHMSTYIYMYDRVLSHNKEMLSFVTKWMSLKDIKSSEINQTQNDKCWMMLLLLGK